MRASILTGLIEISPMGEPTGDISHRKKSYEKVNQNALERMVRNLAIWALVTEFLGPTVPSP